MFIFSLLLQTFVCNLTISIYVTLYFFSIDDMSPTEKKEKGKGNDEKRIY